MPPTGGRASFDFVRIRNEIEALQFRPHPNSDQTMGRPPLVAGHKHWRRHADFIIRLIRPADLTERAHETAVIPERLVVATVRAGYSRISKAPPRRMTW